MIFLSYAKEDAAAVQRIYRELRHAGVHPWMDKPPAPWDLEGIGPGEEWDTVIRQRLAEAELVLVFLSKTSVAKQGYVQREYRLALNLAAAQPPGSVFLIPVLLEDCEPPDLRVDQINLRQFQWIRLLESEVSRFIEYITGIPSARSPASIGARPRVTIQETHVDPLEPGRLALDEAAEMTNRPGKLVFQPAGMLRAVAEMAPSMQYAVSVGCLASIVAIVILSWKLKAQDAILGGLIVAILMVIFVVFAALASRGRVAPHSPALVVAWAYACLTVGVAVLFVSCAFFDKPKTLPCLLQNDCRTMSGTLTLSSPSCSIAAGASSCNVRLTWSTSHPIDISAVTSSYPNANFIIAHANAGGPIACSVPYSSRKFYLYNNQEQLAAIVATSDCASGTVWNGSTCQTP